MFATPSRYVARRDAATDARRTARAGSSVDRIDIPACLREVGPYGQAARCAAEMTTYPPLGRRVRRAANTGNHFAARWHPYETGTRSENCSKVFRRLNRCGWFFRRSARWIRSGVPGNYLPRKHAGCNWRPACFYFGRAEMRSSAILAELSTPGRPAPGCVPAPTK